MTPCVIRSVIRDARQARRAERGSSGRRDRRRSLRIGREAWRYVACLSDRELGTPLADSSYLDRGPRSRRVGPDRASSVRWRARLPDRRTMRDPRGSRAAPVTSRAEHHGKRKRRHHVRAPFRGNGWPTLGVEVELQLVDAGRWPCGAPSPRSSPSSRRSCTIRSSRNSCSAMWRSTRASAGRWTRWRPTWRTKIRAVERAADRHGRPALLGGDPPVLVLAGPGDHAQRAVLQAGRTGCRRRWCAR